MSQNDHHPRGTNGRKSGGRTGSTFMIIHSGLLPDLWNDSSNFKRLVIFLRLVSELVWVTLHAFHCISCSRSIWLSSSSNTASAPIFASNSSPYSSTHQDTFLQLAADHAQDLSCLAQSLRKIRSTERARYHAKSYPASNRYVTWQ